MKSLHVYEIKMMDGTRCRGEIAYRDEKMVVIMLRQRTSEQKLRIFYEWVVSIRNLVDKDLRA